MEIIESEALRKIYVVKLIVVLVRINSGVFPPKGKIVSHYITDTRCVVYVTQNFFWEFSVDSYHNGIFIMNKSRDVNHMLLWCDVFMSVFVALEAEQNIFPVEVYHIQSLN